MLIFQSVVLCNGNIGNHQGWIYSTFVLSCATYQQIGRIYVCKTSKVYQSFVENPTHLLILSYGIIKWTLSFTDHFPYQLLQNFGHQNWCVAPITRISSRNKKHYFLMQKLGFSVACLIAGQMDGGWWSYPKQRDSLQVRISSPIYATIPQNYLQMRPCHMSEPLGLWRGVPKGDLLCGDAWSEDASLGDASFGDVSSPSNPAGKDGLPLMEYLRSKVTWHVVHQH